VAGGVVGEQAQDAGVALEHLGAQLLLDHPRGDLHEGQVVGMRGLIAARDIDRAERLPGLRIVHRRARALPGMDLGAIVLGREDLHGGVGGQRGAHRVGSRGRLTPAVARPEADPLGGSQHVGMAVSPQQAAIRVGDHDDVARVVEQPAEHVAQDVGSARERMLTPAVAGLGLLEHERRPRVGRVDPGLGAAFP
jgi:hypothetical protein